MQEIQVIHLSLNQQSKQSLKDWSRVSKKFEIYFEKDVYFKEYISNLT